MADQIALQTLQNLVQAVDRLERTMAAVFPQGNTIAASAGSASGKYLNVIGTDGNPYKIQLLNPS